MDSINGNQIQRNSPAEKEELYLQQRINVSLSTKLTEKIVEFIQLQVTFEGIRNKISKRTMILSRKSSKC